MEEVLYLSLSDKYVFHNFSTKSFFATQDASLVGLEEHAILINYVGSESLGRNGNISCWSGWIFRRAAYSDIRNERSLNVLSSTVLPDRHFQSVVYPLKGVCVSRGQNDAQFSYFQHYSSSFLREDKYKQVPGVIWS